MSVRRTLALTAGATLLLAGCGGEPEPRFEPTPSASPSESETSAEPEAQSPEEFIREWVELHTKMQNTGDTKAFRAASKGCEACHGVADRVDKIYADGGYVETEGWSVTKLACHGSPDRQRCDAEIDSAPTRYRSHEGGELQELAGGFLLEIFRLNRVNDGWNMRDIAERAQ